MKNYWRKVRKIKDSICCSRALREAVHIKVNETQSYLYSMKLLTKIRESFFQLKPYEKVASQALMTNFFLFLKIPVAVDFSSVKFCKEIRQQMDENSEFLTNDDIRELIRLEVNLRLISSAEWWQWRNSKHHFRHPTWNLLISNIVIVTSLQGFELLWKKFYYGLLFSFNSSKSINFKYLSWTSLPFSKKFLLFQVQCPTVVSMNLRNETRNNFKTEIALKKLWISKKKIITQISAWSDDK